MTPVASDSARDLDDTVARPPRSRVPAAGPGEDLEKTIPVRPTERPLPTLVEPPAPARAAAPVPALERLELAEVPDVPELPDNVWSLPMPERPRPFRLRLADGTLVPLDQPVYLGRKPSVPRIHPGGTPLLVKLDSPQRELSSTHLELSPVGGTIVASDARSTNGSVLRIPGAEPRTLIGGESAVVTPGTVIELGDGNLVEVLAPEPDAAPASTGANA